MVAFNFLVKTRGVRLSTSPPSLPQQVLVFGGRHHLAWPGHSLGPAGASSSSAPSCVPAAWAWRAGSCWGWLEGRIWPPRVRPPHPRLGQSIRCSASAGDALLKFPTCFLKVTLLIFFSKGKKNNGCYLWQTVTSILNRGRLSFLGEKKWRKEAWKKL